MSHKEQVRLDIHGLARRSMAICGACSNEESTKLYLILPFLGLLGYNYADPFEVRPEQAADFDPRSSDRVDLIIMRGGAPAVAIECKKVGTCLAEARGQLRGYFNALPTVKLGILSNGLTFEFFVDSDQPNLMDDEPFLTIDLELIASTGPADEALDALMLLTKASFDPETVSNYAQDQLLKKRMRSRFLKEANAPSEPFCRFFLQELNVKNVRKTSIERHYAPLIKSAFHEALVLPVAQRLRDSTQPPNAQFNISEMDNRITTTDREIAIVNYVRRRLAYLVSNEILFAAIEKVEYKDYIGKLAVFYNRERKGRLFDYIEGREGFDKFVFPDPYGEIITSNIIEIDKPLLAMFTLRVREQADIAPPQLRLAQ